MTTAFILVGRPFTIFGEDPAPAPRWYCTACDKGTTDDPDGLCPDCEQEMGIGSRSWAELTRDERAYSHFTDPT